MNLWIVDKLLQSHANKVWQHGVIRYEIIRVIGTWNGKLGGGYIVHLIFAGQVYTHSLITWRDNVAYVHRLGRKLER